jgi:hypothetical protein
MIHVVQEEKGPAFLIVFNWKKTTLQEFCKAVSWQVWEGANLIIWTEG